MLTELFGSNTASLTLLAIFHYGEIHASGIARDMGLHLTAVLRQLNKFEKAGLLISREFGKSRLYSFNKKSPYRNPVMSLISIQYSALSQKDREILFKHRRPRRKGKPVLK